MKEACVQQPEVIDCSENRSNVDAFQIKFQYHVDNINTDIWKSRATCNAKNIKIKLII